MFRGREHSLRWRLRHANPRGLSRSAYIEAETASRIALSSVEPEDLGAVANAWSRSLHRAGERARQQITGPPLTRDQSVSMFERSMAREARR